MLVMEMAPFATGVSSRSLYVAGVVVIITRAADSMFFSIIVTPCCSSMPILRASRWTILTKLFTDSAGVCFLARRAISASKRSVSDGPNSSRNAALRNV